MYIYIYIYICVCVYIYMLDVKVLELPNLPGKSLNLPPLNFNSPYHRHQI